MNGVTPAVDMRAKIQQAYREHEEEKALIEAANVDEWVAQTIHDLNDPKSWKMADGIVYPFRPKCCATFGSHRMLKRYCELLKARIEPFGYSVSSVHFQVEITIEK